MVFSEVEGLGRRARSPEPCLLCPRLARVPSATAGKMQEGCEEEQVWETSDGKRSEWQLAMRQVGLYGASCLCVGCPALWGQGHLERGRSHNVSRWPRAPELSIFREALLYSPFWKEGRVRKAAGGETAWLGLDQPLGTDPDESTAILPLPRPLRFHPVAC